MRIAIYSPYLDTVGGGEKYMMSIATSLAKEHEVDVLLDCHLQVVGKDKIQKALEERHEIDFSKISLIPAPVGKDSVITSRYFFFQKYDWFFSNTDGSIPLGLAKNNILHFQVPFENTNAKGIWGKIKQQSWKKAICNSYFTKELIEKSWQIPCTVIYPPVTVENFKPLKKKKQIISVGRFFGFLNPKRQDLMVDVFKQLAKEKEFAGWSLHLAGSVNEGDQEYLNRLKEQAKGSDVHFYPNISLNDLIKLYGESSIYWHAAGYGETDPTKFEHFGITTVEAMASGCVPVVISKGGQKEIVANGVDGLLWDSVDLLKEQTLTLVRNEDLLDKLSAKSLEKSKKYSFSEFEKQINKLIDTRQVI